jgi:hypothetical protein
MLQSFTQEFFEHSCKKFLDKISISPSIDIVFVIGKKTRHVKDNSNSHTNNYEKKRRLSSLGRNVEF